MKNKIIVAGYYHVTNNTGIFLSENGEIGRSVGYDELNIPSELASSFQLWVSTYNDAFNNAPGTPFAEVSGQDIDTTGKELAKALKNHLGGDIEVLYNDKYRETYQI